MKVTPLKKPITVSFDCVERAVLFAHLGNDVTLGRISEGAIKMNNILNGVSGGSVSVSIRGQLASQGIDWQTWNPRPQIRIGSYEVEFKPGHINVGCKSVTNETVLAILNRLEWKVDRKHLNAVIHTHGSDELSQSVQRIAFQNGIQWSGGGSELKTQYVKMIGVKEGQLSYWSHETNPRHAGHPWSGFQVFDARTQFGAILDFFKQAQAQPDIRVQGEAVEFNPSQGGIKISGERVTLAVVRDIVSNLIPA